jgi:site-specific DNA recombinase
MPNRQQPSEASQPSLKRSVRYLRVSSKRQMDTDFEVDPEGNSIDTQRKVTSAKEREMGLVNDGEYVEPGNSAQTIDKRPVFKEMIARIQRERDVDYVIVYQMSRAFRNAHDELVTRMMLRKLGVTLVSAKENFGTGYLADTMQTVLAAFNEFQVRASAEDVKVKMGNKVKNGGTASQAKVGYLNVRKRIEGREARTIETDPERAPFVVMAFEQFATGKYTIDSLQALLTEAGLRLRATMKYPARPISTSRLGLMLRDRYYLGYVEYEGIEYPGRHEALITQELFDQVQRVLDSHSGTGTRTRTHNHYLKGTVWCARCGHRFVVSRANGNGGVYFYLLCRGRQEKLCDMPYLNLAAVEQEVLDHYATVMFSDDFKAAVRAKLDEALAYDLGSSQGVRDRLDGRLETLDTKESNLLDLAADGELPKEKIKEKLIAIRNERASIRRDLARLDADLAAGREVFELALELLERPQELYRQASPALRKTMNQTIFTKLMLDGATVTSDELAEPFDAIAAAGRNFDAPTYYRKRAPVLVSRVVFHEGVLADELTETDLLELALGGVGSSKPVMVGDTGIEPVTSSVSGKRSPAEPIARDSGKPPRRSHPLVVLAFAKNTRTQPVPRPPAAAAGGLCCRSLRCRSLRCRSHLRLRSRQLQRHVAHPAGERRRPGAVAGQHLDDPVLLGQHPRAQPPDPVTGSARHQLAQQRAAQPAPLPRPRGWSAASCGRWPSRTRARLCTGSMGAPGPAHHRGPACHHWRRAGGVVAAHQDPPGPAAAPVMRQP